MDTNGSNKILITGALGWGGISLVQALVNGLPDHDALKQPRADLQIRCLVLPGLDTAPLRKISDRIEIVTGDMRNPADCAAFFKDSKGALFIHTAAIIHPRKVSDFYELNVNGTVNLFDAAIAEGVRRAIIVSSNSPCGCNPSRDHLFDEQSPYHPYMNYGKSKMQMELAAKERASKIETVIIRPTWFYGPNQPPRQTLFFQMIRDGKAPIVGDGEGRRSMTYIDNLCQGILLAAASDKSVGQTYWIADKRPYTMNEIVDTVERLLETEFNRKCAHKRMRLPGIASEVAYVVDGMLQSVGMYHQKIHVLSEMNKTIACSVARAEKELGYRPAVALEEGMRRSLKWCLANNMPI